MDKKYLHFFLIVIGVVILDQLTKYLVQSSLQVGESVFALGFFSISYVTNTGIAFGLLGGTNTLLIWISIMFIGGILFYLDRIADNAFWSLVLGGAVGNLIDRIAHGYVVDFLDLSFWPTFNVADSCISIGIVGLMILSWKK